MAPVRGGLVALLLSTSLSLLPALGSSTAAPPLRRGDGGSEARGAKVHHVQAREELGELAYELEAFDGRHLTARFDEDDDLGFEMMRNVERTSMALKRRMQRLGKNRRVSGQRTGYGPHGRGRRGPGRERLTGVERRRRRDERPRPRKRVVDGMETARDDPKFVEPFVDRWDPGARQPQRDDPGYVTDPEYADSEPEEPGFVHTVQQMAEEPGTTEGERATEESAQDVQEVAQEPQEVPQEPEQIPQESQEVPEGIQETPQEVQEFPQEAQEVTEEVQEAPQEVEETQQQVQEAPQEVQEAPQGVQEVTEEVQETPQEVQEIAQEVQEPPQEVEGVPQELQEVSEANPEEATEESAESMGAERRLLQKPEWNGPMEARTRNRFQVPRGLPARAKRRRMGLDGPGGDVEDSGDGGQDGSMGSGRPLMPAMRKKQMMRRRREEAIARGEEVPVRPARRKLPVRGQREAFEQGDGVEPGAAAGEGVPDGGRKRFHKMGMGVNRGGLGGGLAARKRAKRAELARQRAEALDAAGEVMLQGEVGERRRLLDDEGAQAESGALPTLQRQAERQEREPYMVAGVKHRVSQKHEAGMSIQRGLGVARRARRAAGREVANPLARPAAGAEVAAGDVDVAAGGADAAEARPHGGAEAISEATEYAETALSKAKDETAAEWMGLVDAVADAAAGTVTGDDATPRDAADSAGEAAEPDLAARMAEAGVGWAADGAGQVDEGPAGAGRKLLEAAELADGKAEGGGFRESRKLLVRPARSVSRAARSRGRSSEGVTGKEGHGGINSLLSRSDALMSLKGKGTPESRAAAAKRFVDKQYRNSDTAGQTSGRKHYGIAIPNEQRPNKIAAQHLGTAVGAAHVARTAFNAAQQDEENRNRQYEP